MTTLMDRLVKCQQELTSYKTSQPVTTDSGLLYRYDYTPGLFVIDTSSTVQARYHKLKCLTTASLDKALFVTYPSHRLSPQEVIEDVIGLNDEPNIIIWKQEGIYPMFANTDLQYFAPQYLGIFSNVPFTVEVISIDELTL